MKSLRAQHSDLLRAISAETVRGRTKNLKAMQEQLRRLTNKILAKQCRKRLKHQGR